ncbi:MAG: nucleoside monophosphate kinase, partial [Candidatus Falkowbacteria bacterium]|nr:nucleoside monophosphate kinase [Candidatus Falkowbacteria bacterium]
ILGSRTCCTQNFWSYKNDILLFVMSKALGASEIKQRFKEDYSSINVHGQKYSIGISTEKRSADDTRYQSETKEDGKGVSVSINAAGKIKSLTGDSKSISSSGEKENPIATAIGAKQPTPTKEKSGKIAEKIAGGGSGGAFTISPMPRGVLAKKKLEKEDENSESRWHRPIFDSEFQGGIIYRDKKLMHFPDLSNNFISPGETKSPAKENQDKEASTAGSDTSFQEVYDKKKIIILFFGPPGSGKGTQSDLLGKSLNLPIISPGELLRHEEEAGTEIGQAVAKQMAQGQLVPSEIIEQILDLRLSQPDAVLGFILDGYPRSVEQLDFFRQRMARLLTPGDKIIAIYIAVSDKEVESRVSSRRVCDCGAAYHLKYNPPKVAGKCDLCGRELKLREDDKPEVIARRLNDFRQTVRPIIEYFKNSYIYLEVNGEQEISKIKEEIYQRISPIINDNG